MRGLATAMPIREHNSQHDHVGSLPLVSKSATVIDVESMDQDRRGEVRESLLNLGTAYGFEEAVSDRGPIEWGGLRTSDQG